MRIVLGVVRGGHLDPGELFGSGAEFIHVALGCQGIHVHRHQTVGPFVGRVRYIGDGDPLLRAAAAFGARPAGERDQRNLAFAFSDCLCGMRGVDQIGTAANVGRVEVTDLQTHVVDHVERSEAGSITGAEVGVDVLQ